MFVMDKKIITPYLPIVKDNSLIMKKDVLQDWKIALKNKRFLFCLIAVVLLFAGQMTFVAYFQRQIELRNGLSFDDPVFKNFPVISFDIITFIALYTAHLLALVLAFKRSEIFLQLITGYFFVYFFRIISIYLLPLDPPVGTVILQDPFLYYFGGGDITKDLFYSGHTASTFMAFLVTKNRKAKMYIAFVLPLIVIGVLMQRVHYTIDVYAAFFFTFTAYRLSIFVKNKICTDR